MKITVRRYMHNDDATLSKVELDGEFFCYGLEDQPQPDGVKIPNETRIPAGTYDIKFRKAGGMYQKYMTRDWCKEWFEGHLHMQDVPNFTWIYCHPGNTNDHTSGCLLIGKTRNEDEFTIGSSRACYTDFCRIVYPHVWVDDLQIEYIDEDGGYNG
jgi:hypothetical protein